MATPEERARIIAEARETLRARLDAGAPDDDGLARWDALQKAHKERERESSGGAAAMAAPEASTSAAEPATDWSGWERWAASRIDAAIARERGWLCDEVLPEVLAEILEQSRRESRSDIADEREKARKEQKDNVARERRRVDLAIDKAIAGLRGELTRLITDSVIRIEGVVCAERVSREAERGIGGLDLTKPTKPN